MTYFSTQRSRTNDTTNCYIYLSMLPYKTFILNRDTLTIVALYPKSCVNLTFNCAPYNQNQSWCLIRANDGVTHLHFGCIPSMCRCSYVNYIISAWPTFMQLLKTDQTRGLWEITRGLQNMFSSCSCIHSQAKTLMSALQNAGLIHGSYSGFQFQPSSLCVRDNPLPSWAHMH